MYLIFVFLILLSSCQTPKTSSKVVGKSESSAFIGTSDMYALSNKDLQGMTTITEIDSIKAALKSKPNDPKLLSDLANLYLMSGRHESAIQNAKAAIRADFKNSVRARKILAQAYYRANDFDKALVLANHMGGEASSDPDVVNLMGLIALKKGEPEYATTLFTKASELKSDALAPRMNLALVRIKQSRFKDAAIQLERILKIDSDNNDAQLQLGVAYVNLGEYLSAKSLLERSYSKDKSNPYVLFNLALAYHGLKDKTQAQEFLKRYLATDFGRSTRDTRVSTLQKAIARDMRDPKKPIVNAMPDDETESF